MHFSLQATLTTAALAGLVAAGELDISFDKALEGQTGTVQIVDTVPGRLSILASSLGKDATEEGGPQMKAHVRSLLTPRGALEALSGKRALSCEPGYGYCSRKLNTPSNPLLLWINIANELYDTELGGCCPTSDRCCSYGYCLRPGGVCCPSGPCGPGKECCGKSHCMTAGSTCCRDELYCPKGNSCYIVDGVRDSVCCTNSRCTAHVGENGLTTTAPVYTTTRTVTTTRTQYYYWTITWYVLEFPFYFPSAPIPSIHSEICRLFHGTFQFFHEEEEYCPNTHRDFLRTLFC